MNELVFEVVQESDGGFCAECLTESIFTQADDWEQLRDNVREGRYRPTISTDRRTSRPPFAYA